MHKCGSHITEFFAVTVQTDAIPYNRYNRRPGDLNAEIIIKTTKLVSTGKDSGSGTGDGTLTDVS